MCCMSVIEEETIELLRVLRNWLGEDTFKTILRRYYGVDYNKIEKLDRLVSMIREKHGDHNLMRINNMVINDIANILRQHK